MNAGQRDRVKGIVRRRLLARRRAQSPRDRTRRSMLIQRRILALPELRRARTVGAYLCQNDEVNLDALIDACLRDGKAVAVPVWRPADKRYGWRLLADGIPVRTGFFGIREPGRGRWVRAATLDLALVPGVAFDDRGARIGQGGGWYDRLLADTRGTIHTGVAFDFQRLPALPRAAHDIPMHLVITESATRRCGGGIEHRTSNIERRTSNTEPNNREES